MKITNKLCLSVASALLFFGLCTYPAVSLNASQTTVKSQSTTSSTEAVSLKAPYFTVTPGYKSAQITWKVNQRIGHIALINKTHRLSS